jgi:hypothetical protein
MKTKTLAVTFTFAALTAIAGSAFAGAHDGYYRAFYGMPDISPEITGKAAYGTPSGNPWSGHEAYQRAFGGDGTSAAPVEIKGKAAFGAVSGPDGHALYQSAFGSR